MQYLSADGGGTKLIVIRYDENMNLLGVGQAAGTNLNFRSLEDITADMEKAVAEALGEKNPEIEAADFVIVGPGAVFERVIREKSKLGQANRLAEGQAALMAGTGEKYGLLALIRPIVPMELGVGAPSLEMKAADLTWEPRPCVPPFMQKMGVEKRPKSCRF